jgi:lysophospholipase L1-like esterase
VGIVKKSGNTSKSSVATTPGKWWSETIEMIKTSVAGQERKVLSSPMEAKKTVVFTGSSSTEGTGTTDSKTKSYAQLFAAKLGTTKYNFYNRGVGGDNTSGQINRFYKDIAPLNPDFVFLAFTLGNEGYSSATDKRALVNQFKNNILRLCHMVKQLGAVPIVMTQAPTRNYDALFYDYSQKLTEELESAGINMCDWGGVVDAMDGTYKPIDSIMWDDVHYKDAAHVEICNAIPPTLLDEAAFKQGGYIASPKGYIATNTLTSETPISYAPTDLTTYTVAVRVNLSALVSTSIMSFGAQDKVNVTTTGLLALNTFATGTLVQDVVLPDGGIVANRWYHIAVSYNPILKEIRVYVDGVLKLTKTNTAMPITLLTIGGRAGTQQNLKNSFLKDVVVYRTRLTDRKILALFEGTVPTTSLEIFSPLHDKIVSAGQNLINLAPTSVALEINKTETALTAVSSTTI